MMDKTHDPALRAWVASANEPGAAFPIQNLPFGVFRRAGSADRFRIGIAIGDRILDLAACAEAGVFDTAELRAVCAEPDLNALMALGRPAARAIRAQVSALLQEGTAPDALRARAAAWLHAMLDAELALPARIGDYTDFYASIFHATNVGRLFRPDNPLLPNYRWVPIGYHGRASSIVVSGHAVRRPSGQRGRPSDQAPTFGPSEKLDYEAELAIFVGSGNPLGSPVPLGEAEDHVFGMCLLNDWSARDVQSWEYQPLGPFLGKSFATTISPWVITIDALDPFRVPAATRPDEAPAPLPYLSDAREQARGAFAVTVDVTLSSAAMRAAGIAPMRISRSCAADLYWTFGQMLTHHASNGCNLRPGDLLASGTVSGAADDARGCLLEVTKNGAAPLTLPTGESRRFLEDGDEVILSGRCERAGARPIGLGECRGRIGRA
jgi:fumarylacetoacetase